MMNLGALIRDLDNNLKKYVYDCTRHRRWKYWEMFKSNGRTLVSKTLTSPTGPHRRRPMTILWICIRRIRHENSYNFYKRKILLPITMRSILKFFFRC